MFFSKSWRGTTNECSQHRTLRKADPRKTLKDWCGPLGLWAAACVVCWLYAQHIRLFFVLFFFLLLQFAIKRSFSFFSFRDREEQPASALDRTYCGRQIQETLRGGLCPPRAQRVAPWMLCYVFLAQRVQQVFSFSFLAAAVHLMRLAIYRFSEANNILLYQVCANRDFSMCWSLLLLLVCPLIVPLVFASLVPIIHARLLTHYLECTRPTANMKHACLPHFHSVVYLGVSWK